MIKTDSQKRSFTERIHLYLGKSKIDDIDPINSTLHSRNFPYRIEVKERYTETIKRPGRAKSQRKEFASVWYVMKLDENGNPISDKPKELTECRRGRPPKKKHQAKEQ